MATPEDYKTVCGNGAIVLWLNCKGEYTAVRLQPKHSARLLERLFTQSDLPARMTREAEPLAAIEALVEWQAKEMREAKP